MKIKALLLSLIMVFFVGIPVSADVIEVDKPTEPKNVVVEIKDIGFDKKVYHTGENIFLIARIKNLPDEDIKGIKYLVVILMPKSYHSGTYVRLHMEYNKSLKAFKKDISPKEDGTFVYVFSGARIVEEDGLHEKYECSNIINRTDARGELKLKFTINNNCADGLHTVYKDNWKRIKFPSCESEGLDVRCCNICEQVVDYKTVQKLNHVRTNWITTRKSTIWKDGEKVIKCKQCNKILQKQKISKLPSTTQLKFLKKSTTIKKGKSVELKYIRKPINAKDILSWKSSNPKIVKILKNGKVKGLKKGKSIVTLITNTKKKAKIIVKVK